MLLLRKSICWAKDKAKAHKQDYNKMIIKLEKLKHKIDTSLHKESSDVQCTIAEQANK